MVFVSAARVAAAQGASSSSGSAKDASDKSDLLSSKDAVKATGVVTDARCTNGFDLQIKTPTGTLHLHAPPGARTKILTAEGKPAVNTGCRDLQGQRVLAVYRPDSDPTRSGNDLLDSVQLLPDDDASVGPMAAVGAAPSVKQTIPAENPAVKGLPGDKIVVEGKVTDVTCNASEILVKMAVPDGK